MGVKLTHGDVSVMGGIIDVVVEDIFELGPERGKY